MRMLATDLVYHPLTPAESLRMSALRGAMCFQIFCFHYYEAFLKPMGDGLWSGFKIMGSQGYLAVLDHFVERPIILWAKNRFS